MLKNKKKMVKRFVSILSCTAICMTSSVTSFALSYKQPSLADVFVDFRGASTVAEGLKGAVSPNNTLGRAQIGTDENGGKNLKLGQDSSWIEWEFDEVFKKGVLHFGFDAKVDSSTSMYVRGFTDQRYPDNADYREWGHENDNDVDDDWMRNEIWVGMMSIGYVSGKVAYPNVLTEASAPSSGVTVDVEDGWHRYDIYTACGERGVWKTYYFYDGELVHVGGSTSGLKSIGFQGKNAEIDNITVKHYSELSSATTPEEIYLGTEVKFDAAYYDGFLEVAFSEPVGIIDADVTPYPEDFEIKDANGNVIEYAILDAIDDNGRVLLTLNELEEGNYTINVADNDDTRVYYAGKMSKTFPTASAEFTITEGIDYSEKFYYMNEDFDGYTGGMPTSFVDWSLMGPNDRGYPMFAAEGKEGKSLKFSAADNAFYKFPQAIKNGKFTIEFDLYSDTGAGWQIGLPLAHEFESASEWKIVNGYDSTTKKLKLKNIDRDANYFIGNVSGRRSGNGEENILTEVHYSTGKRGNASDQAGTNVWYPIPLGNLSVKPADWNHFKAVVDLDAGTAKIILNNDVANAATINFNNDRFAAEYMIKTTETQTDFNGATESFADGTRKFMPGVGGLKLTALYNFKETIGSTVMDCRLANDVRFDNVQVYTENGYNDFADFSNWAKDRAVKHPGWVVVDNELAPVCDQWLNYAGRQSIQYADKTATEILAAGTAALSRIGAVSRSDSDTALRFRGGTADGTKINSHAVNHFFNVPVKAGVPFDLEFDLYLPTENNAFSLGLLTPDNMCGIEGASGGGNSLLTTVLMNIHQNSASTTDSLGAVSFANGTVSPWDDAHLTAPVDGNGNQIYVTPGKWHKLVLSYIPDDAKAKLQLKVTDLSSGSFKTSQVYQSNIDVTKDITGIQLKQGKFDGNTYFDIDNLKVTEKQSVVKNRVIGAYVVGFDGSREALGDTVLSNVEKIEFELANSISSTEGVSVITNIASDVAGENYMTVEPVLSSDGKSVFVEMNDTLREKAADGFTMSVGFTANICGGSYIDMFEAESFTFAVSQPEDASGELKITDFRLYMLHDELNGVAANWNPVSKDLKDIPEGTKFKFVAKGYYTGVEDKVFDSMQATYNSDKSLKDVTLNPVTVETGKVLYESAEFTVDNTYNFLKGFVWDNMKPLAVANEYAVTFTE